MNDLALHPIQAPATTGTTPPSPAGEGVAAREARAGTSAGLTVGALSLPHGMIAFAPLGPEAVTFGMASALAVSAAAGVWMALVGSSKPLVATTTASTALVLAGLLAAAQPRGLGEAVLLAALLALLSGLLLLAFAAAGIGRLAALMPTPVTMGLGGAVVLVVVASQVPLALGLGPGQALGGAAPHPASLLVAGLAMLLFVRPLPALPPPLAALVAATALHEALGAAGVPLGPVVGGAPSARTLGDGLALAAGAWPVAVPIDLLLPAALSLALLAGLETLSAGAALREASGHRPNQTRDLLAAGGAMMSGAALGGAPASSLSASTLACWRSGGRGRSAMLWRAAVTGALLLAAGSLLARLPYAALAGLLVGAVLSLFQWQPVLVRRSAGRGRRLADALVVLAVALSGLAFGLVAAVGIGVVLAVAVFTGSMAQSVIRRSTRNPVGRSRVRRPAEEERSLRAAGQRIEVVELEGAIFFGSAESVLLHAERARARGVEILILDLGRVTRIDLSGGRRLLEACRATPGRVLLAPLHPGGRAWSELDALNLLPLVAKGNAFPSLAEAVEAAEETLLASLRPAPQPGRGAAEALRGLGLPAEAVGAVLPYLEERRFERGAPILRQGEPADAAYLLLEGEVLISVPASPDRPRTRLAVFSPGVVFGESALLGAMTRSADAEARTEVRCLRLTKAQVEKLRAEEPAVAWHLLTSVARQLAAHVVAANATITHLEA